MRHTALHHLSKKYSCDWSICVYRLARHSSLSEGFKLRPNLSPKERVTKKFESGAKKLLGKVVHRTGPNILLLTQNGTSLNNRLSLLPPSISLHSHIHTPNRTLWAWVFRSIDSVFSQQQTDVHYNGKKRWGWRKMRSVAEFGLIVTVRLVCYSMYIWTLFGLFHSVISNRRELLQYSSEYENSTWPEEGSFG